MAKSKLTPVTPSTLAPLQTLLDAVKSAYDEIAHKCPDNFFDREVLNKNPQCAEAVAAFTQNIMRFNGEYPVIIIDKFLPNGHRISEKKAKNFCSIQLDTTLPDKVAHARELSSAQRCLLTIKRRVNVKAE